MDLDSLMRKYSSGNKVEKDLIENYAELYACLKTLEKLDRAYSRGVFSTPTAKAEYEAECKSLIGQCRINHDPIRHVFPEISNFVEIYSLSCHRAIIRLKAGLPATLEHADSGADHKRSVRDVAEVTEALICLMDVLKLNPVTTVDTLNDPMDQALDSLRKVDYLVQKLEGREKLIQWKAKLASMRAVQAVEEDDVRQMLLDTESAYREFKNKVGS